MTNQRKHFSVEHKRKIGLANKGRKRSEEFKKRMSEIGKLRVGNKNSFYGKKHSEETKQKISQKQKGKMPWQKRLGDNHLKVIEYKRRIAQQSSERNKGKKAWNKGLTKKDNPDKIKYGLFGDKNPVRRKEVRLKISKANKGNLMGDLNPAKRKENRIKIALGLRKAFKDGRKIPFKLEKNPMWKGGLSFEPYTTDWTNALRKFIRERDKHTCQICFNKGNQVHHIDYNKKNCSSENLITLCKKCHSKTNQNRGKWVKILSKKNKGKPLWEIEVPIVNGDYKKAIDLLEKLNKQKEKEFNTGDLKNSRFNILFLEEEEGKDCIYSEILKDWLKEYFSIEAEETLKK